MLIKTIDKDAEQALIDKLDELRGNTNTGHVLHCKLSGTDFNLKPAQLLKRLDGILADRSAFLFFCHDGDLFFWWIGKAAETEKRLKDILCDELSVVLKGEDEEIFFNSYDASRQAEELRDICRKKIHAKQEAARASKRARGQEKERKTLAKAVEDIDASRFYRPARTKPEILIVEDIDPSRKLLKALIGSAYICHAAANAAEAASLYVEHAPDIVFLDIELPDGSGHDLARLFTGFDDDSFIIMATANNFERDVTLAKENKVKGYVTKPLTLEKVHKCMDKYFSSRK